MKESLWGYWLVLLGIMIITVMILLQNYTTTNQQDYYLAKEITYAAMHDAIDYGYYKKHGELKIIKEKFVENFIRRFAESATLNKTYRVNFYSIYETPPAVSVEIMTNTGEFLIGEESVNAGINTRLTAILETDVREVDFRDLSEVKEVLLLPYQKCSASSPECVWNPSKSAILKLDLEKEQKIRDLEDKVRARGVEFDIRNVKYNVEFIRPFTEADHYFVDYKTYICGGTAGCMNSSTAVPLTLPKEVPHSIMHEVENLSDYFATINSADLSYDVDSANQLEVYGSVNFKCNKTLGDSIGISRFRKKMDTEMINNALALDVDVLNYDSGFLSYYDYIYSSKSSGVYKSYQPDSTFVNTPYYNTCLIGFEYHITFTYEE